MNKRYWEPQYTYKDNQYYKLYEQEKENIKLKYPSHIFDSKNKSYTKEDREQHLQYLKELADLIFTPNSNYQKLTWDIMGEAERNEMEKRARGRKRPGTGEYN